MEASSFFITPGDCPLVQKETIWHVANNNGKVVIPSFQMRSGHPILLANEIRKCILEAKADSNLRKILEGYEKNYVNVEDPGVLMDLDTPEDYKRVTEYYNRCCWKRL
ncbi:Molybdenum cofactor cytidylyltransferase [compost metagenome]